MKYRLVLILNIKGTAMRNIFTGHALVVEDNPINQIVLKTQLEILGFTVEVADNGQIALDKIEPDKFRIVFMDIQMPVMGGIDCTIHIRESSDEQVRNIPIIAVTANVTNEYRDQCNDCGMNGFVTKPLNIEELVEQISSLIPMKIA